MSNIVLSIFTLLLAVKGCVSVNVLESSPPSVDEILTACAGQQISLTCSHDTDVATGQTRLIASRPINCTVLVTHITGGGRPCGPFMLEEVTPVDVPPLPMVLNSTIVATAAMNMTDANIECRGGNVVNFDSIGNISLCIVASLPPPTNLMCSITPSGLNVIWELGIDTSCNVNYLVTVVRESDMMTIMSSIQVSETTAELTNTLGLEPNTTFIISVRAVTAGGSCESQEANITCVTPPDLPTEATPPTSTSRGLSAGAIAAIVVVFIVLIIIAVVIVIVVVIVIRISPQGTCKRRDQDGVHDSLGGEQQVNAYAMIDKNTTK